MTQTHLNRVRILQSASLHPMDQATGTVAFKGYLLQVITVENNPGVISAFTDQKQHHSKDGLSSCFIS